MFGEMAFRHEHLNWFSKQLIPCIAEHPLGLSVNHFDEAGMAHHNNRVGADSTTRRKCSSLLCGRPPSLPLAAITPSSSLGAEVFAKS